MGGGRIIHFKNEKLVNYKTSFTMSLTRKLNIFVQTEYLLKQSSLLFSLLLFSSPRGHSKVTGENESKVKTRQYYEAAESML